MINNKDDQSRRALLYTAPVKSEDTIESLRKELSEAKKEIETLKRALGGNHPLGYKTGGLL